jgi:hypothetical protein
MLVKRYRVLPAICLWLLLTSSNSASPVVTAEFAPPVGLNGWFNIGAGMAYDAPAPTPFDNRLAQTFVATTSGLPMTASLIADLPLSTFADLTIDIGRLEGGLAADIIATGTISPDKFGSGVNSSPMTFNGVVELLAIDEITAGETYAIFFRSSTTDANYRIYGTDGNRYGEGQAWRSQNNPMYTPMLSSSDLFFQVTVTPVPEPSACLLALAPIAAMLVKRRSP